MAADRPSARLPARGEFVVRSVHVLTMDPTLGDVERGDIHVRAGQIGAVGKNLQTSGVEVIGGGQNDRLARLDRHTFSLVEYPSTQLDSWIKSHPSERGW